MLMLEDLKKKPEIMEGFEESLMRDKYNHVISEGLAEKRTGAIKLTKDQIEKCKNNFLKASLIFAGVNHGKIIKPLFALIYGGDKSSVFVKEYLTFSNSSSDQVTPSTVENDLTMLAVIVSMHYPEIHEICLPLVLDEFTNGECSLNRLEDSVVLIIK